MRFIRRMYSVFSGSEKREAEKRSDYKALVLVQDMIVRLRQIELSKAENEEERSKILAEPLGVQMPEMLMARRRVIQPPLYFSGNCGRFK